MASEEAKTSAISDKKGTSKREEIREKIERLMDAQTTLEKNEEEIFKLLSSISKDEIEIRVSKNMAALYEKKIALLNEIHSAIDANPDHCYKIVAMGDIAREKCDRIQCMTIFTKFSKSAAIAEKRLVENKETLSTLRGINDDLLATLEGGTGKYNLAKVEKPSCGICTHDYNKTSCIQAAIRFCGHMYCEKCLDQLLKSTKRCPTCAKPFTKKDIQRLFAS